MAKSFPSNDEELLMIKGVGQNKLQKYGDVFLAEIKQYIDENKTS